MYRYTGTMPSFSLDMPGSVAFGPGELRRLPDFARRFGKRLFIVTGSTWLERSGRLAGITSLLGDAVVERFACPAGEPTTATVEEARRCARAFSPNAIVGVGGGSVMDTAKALSGVLGMAEPIERFLEGAADACELAGPGLPWIAVPTTAGTGAEATKNAVLRTALRPGLKRSMRSRFLLACSVVVDPDLTLDLPLEVTGTGGLDALTQLIESFVSTKSNTFVRSLVRGAFLPMLDALERIPGAPSEIAHRTAASYGAFVSGIALANAGLGAAHGFAAGVGGLYEIPHGLLCAVFLPHVLEANAGVIRRLIAELAAGRNGNADPVEWLAGTVRDLLARYGLPSDLRGRGVPLQRVPDIAARSSGSSMKGNPRELSRDEQERILSRVIGGVP